MGKRGKNQKSGNRNPKKIKLNENAGLDDMDDEIDLFHKQRDKIPLDINDDFGESDEDDEQPVFDYKAKHDYSEDEDDEEDDDDEEDEEEDDDEDEYDKSFAKIARTQKYLKAKHGNLEDEFLNDAEDPEEKRTVWGRKKSIYHDADNIDFELQSSDEGSAEEEEAEAIRLRKETAKSMTMEDFGIEDDEKDESDGEPTLEEILVKQKDASMASKKKETEDNLGIAYEEVKKDLSSLSRDEQMDVVSSSAPELVGLLSELNDAIKQLDEVNPLISKVKLQKDTTKKGDLHYLEVKKLLLLAYCQAITFYLLLKSEGQPVRDHPVIGRLVETKSLLDKTRDLDANLPSQLKGLLDENEADVTQKSVGKRTTTSTEHSSESNVYKELLAVEPKAPKSRKVEIVKVKVANDNGLETEQKRHEEPISSQSVKMLSMRAALEEKLKQKGVFTALEPNSQRTKKHKLRLNGQLETFDDFGDDAVDAKGYTSTLSNKVSQLISCKGNKNKVSGDEDLPKRDDLGERRRKHELRVLARAGIMSTDDDGVEDELNSMDAGDADESEDELNNLHAALTNKNPRTAVVSPEPENTVDGKRLITHQMEKNRGLTPHRKKLTKNPRKKYKLKHQKAKKRLGGQVRQVRRPEGPYGGETTGINAGISRSIRFKG